MIIGEIKNRIDQIWDTFWTGGITNSLTILERKYTRKYVVTK